MSAADVVYDIPRYQVDFVLVPTKRPAVQWTPATGWVTTTSVRKYGVWDSIRKMWAVEPKYVLRYVAQYMARNLNEGRDTP